jgi:hypothetical protein
VLVTSIPWHNARNTETWNHLRSGAESQSPTLSTRAEQGAVQ